MGNFFSGGTSISGSAITRSDLLKATSNNRDFTNKLFNAMISKITPIEILSLSNPATCSKYVFLMANSIEKIFEDLKIKPGRDSSGIVYYQRTDKLTAKNPETRQICLLIAYFHIRLFQIFGALALTIIDDSSAGAVLGVLHRDAEADRYKYQLQQTTGNPGFWGGPVRRPGARPAVLVGGAVDEFELDTSQKKPFIPLKDIISGPYDVTIPDVKSTYQAYYFEGTSIYLVFGLREFNLYYTRDDQHYYAKLDIAPLPRPALRDPFRYGAYRDPYDLDVRGEQYKITLSSFNYNNKTDSSLDAAVKKLVGSKTWPPFVIRLNNMNDWVDSTSGKPFLDILKEIFYKKINEAVKKVSSAGAPDPGLGGRGPGLGAPAPGGPGRMSDVGSSGELITQYIIDTIKNISKGGSTSFCVARALQLMDAQSSFQPRPTQIRSSVCKKPFTELLTSVPQSKLVEVPSLRVLEQLYSVNPHVDPKTEKINFQMDVQYISFLTRMQGIFNKSATGTPSKLATISPSVPSCAAAANKYLNITDPASINKIVGFSKALFGIQLAHTKKVINFFKTRLFTPKKSDWSIIDIHPKLLDGDIKVLEQVSKDARELLIEYYKACEEKYQFGVQAVLNSKYVAT